MLFYRIWMEQKTTLREKYVFSQNKWKKFKQWELKKIKSEMVSYHFNMCTACPYAGGL